ncbi:hypothetical protein PIB30_092431 [Stylosanthes scabra]|uniref:Uncharacterized protein n=1 Tax=Stylosanthes scabra TaxID=79078 RepID=A0ABU6ZU46_9FABA|nr:hypothetical protein [Stylosanthes scabra]
MSGSLRRAVVGGDIAAVVVAGIGGVVAHAASYQNLSHSQARIEASCGLYPHSLADTIAHPWNSNGFHDFSRDFVDCARKTKFAFSAQALCYKNDTVRYQDLNSYIISFDNGMNKNCSGCGDLRIVAGWKNIVDDEFLPAPSQRKKLLSS